MSNICFSKRYSFAPQLGLDNPGIVTLSSDDANYPYAKERI